MYDKNREFGEVRTPKRILNNLARMAIEFATITRAPVYSPQHNENDAEHTFMLSLIAPELAKKLYPDLDEGLIRAYATVHDLIELETGDKVSLTLTMKQVREKDAREKVALDDLIAKLPPLTTQRLLEYEGQGVKEARFVKAVDKLLPSATDLKTVADERSNIVQDRMERIFGIKNLDDMKKAHRNYMKNFRIRFGDEFPELLELLQEQMQTLTRKIKFLDDPQGTFDDLPGNDFI